MVNNQLLRIGGNKDSQGNVKKSSADSPEAREVETQGRKQALNSGYWSLLYFQFLS